MEDTRSRVGARAARVVQTSVVSEVTGALDPLSAVAAGLMECSARTIIKGFRLAGTNPRQNRLPLGVTGNTPDSGSGESWFDPRRGNSIPTNGPRAYACGPFRFQTHSQTKANLARVFRCTPDSRPMRSHRALVTHSADLSRRVRPVEQEGGCNELSRPCRLKPRSRDNEGEPVRGRMTQAVVSFVTLCRLTGDALENGLFTRIRIRPMLCCGPKL